MIHSVFLSEVHLTLWRNCTLYAPRRPFYFSKKFSGSCLIFDTKNNKILPLVVCLKIREDLPEQRSSLLAPHSVIQYVVDHSDVRVSCHVRWTSVILIILALIQMYQIRFLEEEDGLFPFLFLWLLRFLDSCLHYGPVSIHFIVVFCWDNHCGKR